MFCLCFCCVFCVFCCVFNSQAWWDNIEFGNKGGRSSPHTCLCPSCSRARLFTSYFPHFNCLLPLLFFTHISCFAASPMLLSSQYLFVSQLLTRPFVPPIPNCFTHIFYSHLYSHFFAFIPMLLSPQFLSKLLTRPFVHQLFPPFQTFSLTIQFFYSHSIFFTHISFFCSHSNVTIISIFLQLQFLSLLSCSTLCTIGVAIHANTQPSICQ